MKKTLGFLALSLLLLPGCSTEQRADSQNESQRREAAQQERKIYQDQIEAKFRELDQRIAVLKMKLKKDNKLTAKQVNQQLAELKSKRDAAGQKLDKLRIASGAAWEDVKTGMDAATDDLEAAYRQAASHFK